MDVAHVVDGSGVSHGNTDHSAGVMPPPKRSKLYGLFSFAIFKIYIMVIDLASTTLEIVYLKQIFKYHLPVSYLHFPSPFCS